MAASRNYTEVIIDGKVFTLSGFESEEYLQKVSNYLNHNVVRTRAIKSRAATRKASFSH